MFHNFLTIGDTKSSPWEKWTIPLVLVVAYMGFASVLSLKGKLNNEAFFGGDTWEYQSMAVNFSKGRGLMVLGCLESYENYKFEKVPNSEKLEAKFRSQKEGKYHFYRTPGYIVFLGSLYWLFGINPLVVKLLQLMMLCASAWIVVYLGNLWWGRLGKMAGIFASLLFLFRNYHHAANILTESLIIFSISLFVLFSNVVIQNKKALGYFFLGGYLGLCLLIKGSVIFVLPLISCYLICAKVGHFFFKFTALYFLCLGTILVITPYSYFASSKLGKPILLSTQSKNVFLDGNNEKAWQTGGWEPEWRKKRPNVFYNQPAIRQLKWPQKLFKFVTSHKKEIFRAIERKIRTGFMSVPHLKYFLVLLLALMCFLLSTQAKTYLHFYPFFVVILWFGLVQTDFNFSAVLLVAGMYYLFLNKENRTMINYFVPIEVVVLFLNFLILTVLLFGHWRFTSIIDGFYLLLFFNLIFHMYKKINIEVSALIPQVHNR